ncbi:40S ribosomal protein S7-like isoform X2 [Spinacia oleracea]|uniref:40S ribosomal protein S7 n=1 Tax=Spinacia oleracea TaxID=3562 RepID=A0A9R0IUE1_SPIOL|nr:40S ribosomal protein S7-like isoform X2 [Spinacia oleracea]XP_056683371.1 40S ribosomal protein S7-like isoform X2 [Spinacia oleracea]XP_056683372.1 40S ribosomal protein S7-like isoform X2 [Spinacia oleracea]
MVFLMTIISEKVDLAQFISTVKMFTALREIQKERGVNPTDLEENLAQAIFDFETNNKDMGTELKDRFMNSVAQVDISNNKKAIVFHVPYRLRKAIARNRGEEASKEFSSGRRTYSSKMKF